VAIGVLVGSSGIGDETGSCVEVGKGVFA